MDWVEYTDTELLENSHLKKWHLADALIQSDLFKVHQQNNEILSILFLKLIRLQYNFIVQVMYDVI